MDGQRVDFNFLPSHGVKYPDDIEIYVEPLPIKQQIDMERYGISDAEYFEILDRLLARDEILKYIVDVEFTVTSPE